MTRSEFVMNSAGAYHMIRTLHACDSRVDRM
jgi:hypothetical protein